jgi:hypothetical protein
MAAAKAAAQRTAVCRTARTVVWDPGRVIPLATRSSISRACSARRRVSLPAATRR